MSRLVSFIVVPGLWVLLFLVIGWLGFQIKPRPFPAQSRRHYLGTVDLPPDLPEPVRCYYLTAFGAHVPRVETLVVWAGEFGRTPFAQGSNGRDHNPFGFSIWLAGGGTRGGVVYGETDEWGYKVVKGRTEVHDLHATMLHLLGIDHKKLTMRFGGRDMRLTDVHGEVVRSVVGG